MNLNGMVSRRNFIQLGASAALALATLPQWSIGNAAAAARPRLVSLDTCLTLSPQEMAERSELVQQAYQYLLHTVQSIQDNDLRQQVLNIIDNPAPTVMQRYPEESDRRELWQRLLAAQYIDGQASAEQLIPPFSTPTRSVQPWLSAPGSGYGSHHSYPGGLSTHTAANVSIALSIHRTYQDIFGYSLNKDIIIAAQALHDLHKPWVFQWLPDGSARVEKPLAGQGAHHILSLAESIYRGLPAEVIIAQACAHTHPGSAKDEADVVSWLKAAALIADRDPLPYGLLTDDGQHIPFPQKQEGYITHLGDHDFVLSVPAAQRSIEVLKTIARRHYGMNEVDSNGRPFFQFRNYVASQVSMLAIHQTLASSGEDGVTALVKTLLRP